MTRLFWFAFKLGFLAIGLPCQRSTALAHNSDRSEPPFIGNCPNSNTLTLALAGDLFLGHRLMGKLKESPPALELLRNHADFVVANLEGALTNRKERAFPEQLFHHRMSPSVSRLMRQWGVSAVTLANNHTMDFGADGLRDTKRALQENSILFAGAGDNQAAAETPLVLEANGIKVHLLSFNVTYPEAAWASAQSSGVAYPWPERLAARVKDSAQIADYVIVSFHWGQELSLDLRDYQPRLAQIAMKAGADFVYGHHAHIAQSIGAMADGRLIAYGLGNFLFDSISPQASFGLAALIRLCSRHSGFDASTLFIPLLTHNAKTDFATRPMTELEFQEAAKPYKNAGLFDQSVHFWLSPDP